MIFIFWILMLFNIDIAEDIFNPIYFPYLENNSRYEILYGGAGSGKSVFVSQKKIKQHLENSHRNTLVIRKVDRTNRSSTFAEILKVIYRWKLQSLFTITRSNMVITRKDGGQIKFFGMDNPEKIKSTTFERGDLTDIWIEEANELTEEDFEQLDLRLRGLSSIPFQICLTFNPISELSWIKNYFFDRKLDNCITLKTTYLNNNFIDDAYKKKLIKLKETNKNLYNIYALGNWGSLGNLIYSNYIIEDLSQRKFDRYYNGLDWGYNDPAAGLKMAFYDNEIYILNELYERELRNIDLMQKAQKIWTNKDRIIADNNEPKSIEEWRRKGWKIQAAEKGKDSVRYGINWIGSHKIHINSICSNFIKEIKTYSFRKDKNDNVLEEPVDFNNHCMDAMRYGFESIMQERYQDSFGISIEPGQLVRRLI